MLLDKVEGALLQKRDERVKGFQEKLARDPERAAVARARLAGLGLLAGSVSTERPDRTP